MDYKNDGLFMGTVADGYTILDRIWMSKFRTATAIHNQHILRSYFEYKFNWNHKQ